MSNPNKSKGTRWETAVVRFLRAAGLANVFKPRQEGMRDVGDIHAPPVVLQAKAYAGDDLLAAIRRGVQGAETQRANAGMPFGFAVIKRPRKPVGDAYVVFRLADLPDLIRALRGE